VSGTVVRRCESCHRAVLLADHGDVLPVGGARIIGVSKHGDSTVQCACGQTLTWLCTKRASRG
jgi:hypothetical protein